MNDNDFDYGQERRSYVVIYFIEKKIDMIFVNIKYFSASQIREDETRQHPATLHECKKNVIQYY